MEIFNTIMGAMSLLPPTDYRNIHNISSPEIDTTLFANCLGSFVDTPVRSIDIRKDRLT